MNKYKFSYKCRFEVIFHSTTVKIMKNKKKVNKYNINKKHQ